MEGSGGDTACWKETGIWNETQAPDLPVPLEGREAVADGGDWRWESCFNVLPVLPGQIFGPVRYGKDQSPFYDSWTEGPPLQNP